MQRLDLDDDEVEQKRQEALALNASFSGTWPDPRDDPKREVICEGSPLKPLDDVETSSGRFRVVAPGLGRDRFVVVTEGMWLTMVALSEVIDRAPLDPSETAMPVLPEGG